MPFRASAIAQLMVGKARFYLFNWDICSWHCVTSTDVCDYSPWYDSTLPTGNGLPWVLPFTLYDYISANMEYLSLPIGSHVFCLTSYCYSVEPLLCFCKFLSLWWQKKENVTFLSLSGEVILHLPVFKLENYTSSIPFYREQYTCIYCVYTHFLYSWEFTSFFLAISIINMLQ